MSGHNADNNPLLQGDTDSRIDAAIATAGTTDPIEVHITDWGDFDGDYTAAQHAAADGSDGSADRHERVFDSMNADDNDIRIL